ncbi:hypothetical protein GOB87_11960 [Acetobacter estunensis]|uniref:Uncharacterized protein n=1 Tax=Acetobacter estunensis TaxID=104097 RepID=A0A967B6C8_9PROT|nr:hypothetical protein [Acetobacter estunensis]NHO54650.1 hypothetical protein [Acetobacter estunensis]
MGIDREIWQSACNIEKSQKNLDRLCREFDSIECNMPDFVIEYEDKDKDGGNWIAPVYNFYYKVKQRPNGRLKVTGWITLAVQLTCEESVESDWTHGKRAKVLAGFSADAAFDEVWLFDLSAPNSAGFCEDCTIEGDLWVYNQNKNHFFFAIPLDVLISAEAVERYIITPMRSLIRSEEIEKVFSAIKNDMCLPPQL